MAMPAPKTNYLGTDAGRISGISGAQENSPVL